MQLYSGPVSLFTAKVRIALAEKGLDYDRTEVGWSIADRYIPHHPDVARLNPKAEVPVLVDGDVTLYDSTVILEYLEDRYPSPALYPIDAAQRARCRQLEAFSDEIVFQGVWDLVEESLYPAGAEGRDETRLSAAKSGLADHYTKLEAQLGAGKYFCGEYSVADIAIFIMVNAATTLGASLAPEHEQLQAWLERIGARPHVAVEVAEMVAFLGKSLAPAG